MRSALFLAVFAAVVGRGGCAPDERYDPCDAKRCGEACRLCDPDGSTCVETAVVMTCNREGQCVADGTSTCEPPYDPCAGRACGESCNPCDPPCMTFAATACDAKGACATVGTFTCEPPPPPPDPCAGKACGDPCNTCPPGALCPAVMMYCDAAGLCGYAYPACKTAAP